MTVTIFDVTTHNLLPSQQGDVYDNTMLDISAQHILNSAVQEQKISAQDQSFLLTFTSKTPYHSNMQPLSPEEKDKVEKQLADTMLSALDQQKITQEDSQEISQFVLMFFGEIQTKEQLDIFLKTVARKWPIFQAMLAIEEGQVQHDHELDVAKQVEELTKQGKVEEALALAKSATK